MCNKIVREKSITECCKCNVQGCKSNVQGWKCVQASYFAEALKVSCLSVLVLVFVVHSVEDSDFVPELALVEAFSEEEELLEVSVVVG